MVKPPLTMYGDVGPLTGSIRHAGNVRILGSVLPGYEVIADGDLLVSRDVRDATLVSRGGIDVNGTVSGPRTVVDALGSVRLRQVADARVLSGGDIEVRVAAERSDLRAVGWIRLTGRPGILRAGRTFAGAGVECFRVETGVGEVPRIEVGPFPFEKTPDEIQKKLAFVRGQLEKVEARPAPTELDYRRKATDRSSYAQLAATLEHRLEQAERVDAEGPAPVFRVLGNGRARARVRLGPVEDALKGLSEQWTGRFQLELCGEEAKVIDMEEAARVG
jgi:hypothetical protein